MTCAVTRFKYHRDAPWKILYYYLRDYDGIDKTFVPSYIPDDIQYIVENYLHKVIPNHQASYS